MTSGQCGAKPGCSRREWLGPFFLRSSASPSSSACQRRAVAEQSIPAGSVNQNREPVVDGSKYDQITSLLTSLSPENAQQIAHQLAPLVYDDLRELAQKYFRNERADHTLQPTALVHEVYLRLADQARVDFNGRAHFMAVCAKVMRQILVDYARGRGRQRRGGGKIAQALDSDLLGAELHEDDVLGLNESIEQLTQLDPRQAKVVELRFFGGLNMDEVAQAMGVSKRTAEAEWTHARAWLKADLEEHGAG